MVIQQVPDPDSVGRKLLRELDDDARWCRVAFVRLWEAGNGCEPSPNQGCSKRGTHILDFTTSLCANLNVLLIELARRGVFVNPDRAHFENRKGCGTRQVHNLAEYPGRLTQNEKAGCTTRPIRDNTSNSSEDSVPEIVWNWLAAKARPGVDSHAYA